MGGVVREKHLLLRDFGCLLQKYHRAMLQTHGDPRTRYRGSLSLAIRYLPLPTPRVAAVMVSA